MYQDYTCWQKILDNVAIGDHAAGATIRTGWPPTFQHNWKAYASFLALLSSQYTHALAHAIMLNQDTQAAMH
jgi:hypothetical protein